MRTVVVRVVGGLTVVLAMIAAVFVMGMRRRSPTVINTVRRLARATKRVPLRSAERSRAYASVVRHVGRASGRAYETPVRAVATDHGFVVALPYGSTSDWVKNVRAAGTAVIIHDGTEQRVDHPMLVPLSEAENTFAPGIDGRTACSG
jgi:deazaflavin-dependent oxidoreductase (nitroreductase family)